MNIPEEGYYALINKGEIEPVLVHGYHCSDMDGQFVFGFNTYDGGGLVPLFDLSEETTIIKVSVKPRKVFKRSTSEEE